jgi:hypothetical protein
MTPLETLRALGTGEDAPTESKQRVYGALLASLEVAALAGAIAAAPKPPVSVHRALIPASAVSAKTAAIAVSIWVLGGVTGAALYGALRPSGVRVVYVERPAVAATPPTPAKEPEVATGATVVPGIVAPRTAPARHGPAPTSAPASASASAAGPASELARERTLLDLARSSAAQGDSALALERAEQHRQQFPRGHLSEEREALVIRALVALGRGQEARERAQVFRSAFPNSFLTPVIDSALSNP